MYLLMMVEIIVLVGLFFVIMVILSFGMIKSETMMNSYECGFDSGMGSRVSFSYRFFLISILFLVFDVEVTLLVPLPFIFSEFFNSFGVWLFLLILMFGLLYEYFNGVLEWMDVGVTKS